MSEENKEIMNEQDVKLLMCSFPDLKDEKGFPKEPTSAAVADFVSGYMEKCGVKGRPSEMLEYLSVAASMKAVAQASLGKLDGNACASLSLSHQEAKEDLSNIAKGEDGGISKVDENVRQSISTMDFKTVAAMFPMQAFMRHNFEAEFGKLDINDMNSKNLNRLASIPQFGGNETGVRDFEPGEFTRTAGYRIRQSVTNDLFDNYAGMYLVANALQVRSALALGENFPQMSDRIKENTEFFAMRAAESVAVCHALNEGKQKVNSFEVLQDMVAAPETKDFACSSYAQVFPAYVFLADPQKGKCPLTYGDRNEAGEISMPRNLSKAENGEEFMKSIQKQAGKTIGLNRQMMANFTEERLKA